MSSVSAAPKPFKGCLLTGLTTTSVPNNTPTVLAYNSAVYDTDNFHENVINPERITIPSGIKKVRFTFGLRLFFATLGDFYLEQQFRLNGSQLFAGALFHDQKTYTASDTHSAPFFSSPVVPVSEGDYVTHVIMQNSGSGANLDKNNTWFSMEVIK